MSQLKVQRILDKLGFTGFGFHNKKQLSTNKEHIHESVTENGNEPIVQALTSGELDVGLPEPKQMSTLSVSDDDSDLLSTQPRSDLKNATMQEKKKKVQPEGTIAYIIQESDTLEKIAAHFDTTPSELKKLNKLISAMIFPGQTLCIPVPRKSAIMSLTSNDGTLKPSHSADKNGSPEDKSTCPVLDTVTTGNSLLDIVPSHTERPALVSSSKETLCDFALLPPHKLTDVEVQKLDKACMEKFLKINVRHITDGQGVVKGTLLVTPNAIMFDPDVLDPLVIEHGAETYGMIALMDMIISAAMYHDIAAMKMRGQIMDDGTEYQMPEVYHDLSCPMAKQRLDSSHKQQDQFSSVLPKHVRTILSNPLNRQDSVCSCGALERSNSIVGADNRSIRAEDNVNKDNDYHRTVDVAEECDKGGNWDPELYKDLCAMEADRIMCKEGNEVESHSEDFGLDKNNGSETSVSKIDAKSNISELHEGKLDTEAAVDNVTDAGSKKMKSNIILGRVQRQSSVTFSSPEHDEVRSISSDALNDIVANANENNVIEETTNNDGAKSNGVDNDMMKTESKICQTSDDGNDMLVGKRANNGICVNAGADMPVEKDTNDQTPKEYVKKTETNASQLNLEEFEEIYNPEFDNADSIDISKTEIRSVEKVRSSSTSLLAPFSPTAHLSAFVTYATGFFQQHASDSSIRDNKDVVTDSLTDSKPEEPRLKKELDIAVIAAAPGKSHGKMSHGDVKSVAVKSAVTMAEKPDLLTMDYSKFAPKPAAMFKDPPLYLCLRLGRRPIEKYSYHNYSIESYGRRCKRSEYWFSIPREKVDSLYAFLVQWTPEIYGDDEEITPEKRGFVVIEDGYNEDLEEQFGTNRNFHKDWEIISQSEALKRRSIVFEVPLPLPELIGESAVITEKHIASLSPVMTGRIVGYPWTLMYSTDKNGFSLNTLYRVMVGLDSPVLIVVLDDHNNVFGALTSCPPKISDSFYGTGESFLFTFYPEFKVFTWSGENNFFMKGNKESLSIGAGHGVFGLWFDEDLYHGRTNKCETFNNDLLTSTEDFIVKGFEAWAFFWD